MAGRNTKSTSRDMIISMAVLLVPIALIAWWFTSLPDPEVETVDVGPVLARAEAESSYPVLHPENLPEDWTPVRVAWASDGEAWIDNKPAVGGSWQLGYLAPNEIYVAVQQRDRDVAGFVKTVTRDGVGGRETVDLGGRQWERMTSLDERTRSLVWREGDMVAVVTGDTDFEQLEAFAATLVG